MDRPKGQPGADADSDLMRVFILWTISAEMVWDGICVEYVEDQLALVARRPPVLVIS